jgi:hypothetical protein
LARHGFPSDPLLQMCVDAEAGMQTVWILTVDSQAPKFEPVPFFSQNKPAALLILEKLLASPVGFLAIRTLAQIPSGKRASVFAGPPRADTEPK